VPRFDTISFLTDYGTSDEFVGVVKSVIRQIAPHAAVIDITHDIPPYDTRAASLTLARSVQYLCPGVVLAVVDPGVGTDRRAVAVEVGDGQSYLVGPDNGMLAPAVGLVGGVTAAVALTNPEYQLAAPGPTFAGRDVFGPAAAHLCAGVPLEALGDPVDLDSLLPGLIPLPRPEPEGLVAEVLWVDRYGNCQLNIDPDEVIEWGDRIQLRWIRPVEQTRTATRARTFDELGPGQVGLVTDSYGLLAVALQRGSAADELGLRPTDEVTLVRLDGGDADRPGADRAGSAAPGRSVPVTLGPRPTPGPGGPT
jgi:hypothetical protein